MPNVEVYAGRSKNVAGIEEDGFNIAGNRYFLAKRGYPIMKESAEFLLDFLVEDDQGRLVTNPSTSPENKFSIAPGKSAYLCVGSSMDFQIAHDLFTNEHSSLNTPSKPPGEIIGM